MRVNNISLSYYKPTSGLPLQTQGQYPCAFSADRDVLDKLTPTEKEIQGVIAHLPKNKQEAKETAKKDVMDMASQVVRLVRTGEIKSTEDFKEYMEPYTQLGKKVFDKMTPKQKAQSIMLQEKSIEEMQNLKSIAKRSSKNQLLQSLVDVQIQMSQELLQYCNEHKA